MKLELELELDGLLVVHAMRMCTQSRVRMLFGILSKRSIFKTGVLCWGSGDDLPEMKSEKSTRMV